MSVLRNIELESPHSDGSYEYTKSMYGAEISIFFKVYFTTVSNNILVLQRRVNKVQVPYYVPI